MHACVVCVVCVRVAVRARVHFSVHASAHTNTVRVQSVPPPCVRAVRPEVRHEAHRIRAVCDVVCDLVICRVMNYADTRIQCAT